LVNLKKNSKKNLFGVVVEFGVGEADAGAEKGYPGAPLHPHHQGTHGEHHALKKCFMEISGPKSKFLFYEFPPKFRTKLVHKIDSRF
jgi:hypothetical protein